MMFNFLPNFRSIGFAVSEEKIKSEKLTDDGRQVMAKAHNAFGKER
jgi:hypothetical protein